MRIISLLFSFLLSFNYMYGNIIEIEGKGFLEEIHGQRILHLKGSPYEIGFQHGKLLRTLIHKNFSHISNAIKKEIDQSHELHQRNNTFISSIPNLISHIPSYLQEELHGLADGSGLKYESIVYLNLLPELFHCSAIVAKDYATVDSKLYHVRVLDYSAGKGIEKSETIIICEPDQGIPFMNISYAGFIGCVTGMNKAQLSIGEIGGKGYGNHNGIAMPFLLRHILQNGNSLEQVDQILSSSQRTGEYYYIFSDGKSQNMIAYYASRHALSKIHPDKPYAIILNEYSSSKNSTFDADEKIVSSMKDQEFTKKVQLVHKIETKEMQKACYNANNQLIGLYHQQPLSCLLLTGFSSPERYSVLCDRIQTNWGALDSSILQEIIKTPVCRPSNLHNAIFKPDELKVWLAYATESTIASNSPYYEFNLNELLKHTTQ